MNKSRLDTFLWIVGSVAFLCVIAFFVWWQKSTDISVTADDMNIETVTPENAGILTGSVCKNPKRRPVAVMFASDVEARPLSGISLADMVFEMPVAPNGITRIMAVYQCEDPDIIGSVRSARNDFIPLAMGLNAILAHWGGERDALVRLDNGIMDNIDAMKYEGSTYYRKKGTRPPHNGFTSMDLLVDRASKLEYDLENTFSGYPHTPTRPARNLSNFVTTVPINFVPPFSITWIYDEKRDLYDRWRDGTPEMDDHTGEQVSASTIVVMQTSSRFLRDQYISVSVSGQGKATVHRNGVSIPAVWQKGSEDKDPLLFVDRDGIPILFAPGTVWVEIVTD